MKKTLLLSSLLLSSPNFAEPLHNYDQITNAINNGETVHIVVDFTKCTSRLNKPLPQVLTGVFAPDVIQIVNNTILTSFTHFTVNNPAYPKVPVYEFASYTITNDAANNVKIVAQVLEATTYTPMPGGGNAFMCQIDESAKFYS